jgi:hypothetical protein
MVHIKNVARGRSYLQEMKHVIEVLKVPRAFSTVINVVGVDFLMVPIVNVVQDRSHPQRKMHVVGAMHP